MIVLLVVVAVVLAVVFIMNILHQQKITNNTVIAFTGSLGTGKTFLGVRYALKMYRKGKRRYAVKKVLGKVPVLNNLICPYPLVKPHLYSNIPIRINKKEWAFQLKREHILLEERLPEGVIVFVDEIGQFASQYDYDNPLVMCNLQEFIRFFRHYVDGRFILTDQSSSNIVVPIRRRISEIYALNNFRRVFLFFYKVNVEIVKVTEEIVTIQNENQARVRPVNYFFGYLPFRYHAVANKVVRGITGLLTLGLAPADILRHYDSRCYSINYKAGDGEVSRWSEYKTDYFIDIPCNQRLRKAYREQGRLPADYKDLLKPKNDA